MHIYESFGYLCSMMKILFPSIYLVQFFTIPSSMFNINKLVLFVLTFNYSIIKQLMENIVQNLSINNVLHVLDHFKCLTSLEI